MRCSVFIFKQDESFSVLCKWIIELSEAWEPSSEYQENGGGEEISVCVFPDFSVPVCSATLNIPVGKTSRYAPSKLQVTIKFQSKTYNSDVL